VHRRIHFSDLVLAGKCFTCPRALFSCATGSNAYHSPVVSHPMKRP
jgi:hypothetical protein